MVRVKLPLAPLVPRLSQVGYTNRHDGSFPIGDDVPLRFGAAASAVVPVLGMRPANALTAAVFVVLGAIVVSTFRDYGISWDEELHVAYGNMLWSYYASGFADRSAFSFINLYLYGGFFDLLVTGFSKFLPFGVYESRHLVGGLLFLAGLCGAWRLTRLLAGDRAALIAVICLASEPMLFGHSYMNPKDAPLAWLGVWVAYYACRALGEEPYRWRTVAGLGISLGLALGTRTIAFAFIAQIAAVLAVRAIATYDTQRTAGENARCTFRRGLAFLLAAPLAAAVMALAWPWSFQDPLNIFVAFKYSANQFWHPSMLWEGEIINAGDLPRDYLIGLLAVKLPEYVLIGAALFAVHAAAQARSLRRSTFAAPAALQYLYVAFTVIVPLAAFAVLRPSTYNGLRHFLFVVPQLVILAAVGLDRALAFFLARRRAAAIAFSMLLLAAVLHQIIVMVRVHPYQYLAFNALTGGVKGAYGRFELDYWGVTYGEAVRGLAQVLDAEGAAGRPVPERSTLFVCGANTSAGYYLPDNVVITEDRVHADFFLGGDLTNPRCPIRPEGETVFVVMRDETVLSYVLDLRAKQP